MFLGGTVFIQCIICVCLYQMLSIICYMFSEYIIKCSIPYSESCFDWTLWNETDVAAHNHNKGERDSMESVKMLPCNNTVIKNLSQSIIKTLAVVRRVSWSMVKSTSNQSQQLINQRFRKMLILPCEMWNDKMKCSSTASSALGSYTEWFFKTHAVCTGPGAKLRGVKGHATWPESTQNFSLHNI